MGNEASLEGGAGDGPLPPGGSGPGPGPGAGKPPSALAGGGQLPATGAARATAGPAGPGPGPGGGPGSVPRRLDPKEPLGSQRAASPTPKQPSATTPGRESPREPRAQGPEGQEADGPRRTLQVDSRTQRSGRSPSVSPDRGSTPTSPYSVPQIAPLPSSTLCPICKTSDLTSTPSQPNFNTCTQCHNKVCNQCGFNPNPHLTQVKEWLCLNCQMQRALGMDMTTAPRSKSQQQLHSPGLSPAHSPAKQPLGKPEQERARGPGGPQPGPRQAETARATSVPGPAPAAAPLEVGKVSPQPSLPIKPSTAEPRPPAGEAPAKSATAAPSGPGAAEPTQEGLTGKLFGLGASLLTQASTLMSAQPEVDSQGQPAPSKGPPKIVFSDASKEAGPRPPGSGPGPGPGPATRAKTEPGSGPRAQARTGGSTSPKHGRTEHQAASKAAAKPKTTPKERATCPLCQAELNMGSKGPANYNTCTTCKLQVCNLCGFNPTPHLVEKTEWLCLNCQTKRLLEGSLGEPTPLPLPTSQQPPVGAPHHTAGTAPPKQKGPQGLSQPSGPPPAKATPLPTKASPLPTKASPQAKPARASEPSRTPSSAQEKKTGVPAKAEPVPKPPPETTLPPGTPKAKTGVRRTEPTTPITKAVPEAPKGGETEEPGGKPYSQDLSRSPQSLSDTGYSSDGISSSQSEITGIVRQEMEQLDSAGVTGPRPPSPSELHKVGSSLRPSLEAQGPAPSGERSRPPSGSAEEQKRRPRSLSIMPEAFNSDEELEEILEEEEDSTEWGRRGEQQDAVESSDDFGSQLRHDYVEDSSEGGLSPLPPQPPARAADLTDEEFMRRQILEMSAEEDNLEEDEAAPAGPGLAKHTSQKGGPRPRPESSQDPGALPKRRLPHNATTGYEELLSEGGPAEDVDGTAGALQGGLRRFKTIELNSTGSYSHELDMGPGPDPSLDREPELEMESLTGSPEDRSRGEHSSTLPASTPSYTSGTSPTSLSSLEEDSDSSPSRRQRLEEAKQQRKARHRSHGPLLPTIEDSSEEEELREEEELLREQEKMREVEQQRIRSTARKTRRDKEELRAQRRRERSKTPPSNLSPIEDASPTEELRQAAEMEELHRSSCSEYSPSPSLDSEAEAPEGAPSRLYKSGSEYNLPTFMSLYSPTETPSGSATTPSSGRPLKSAEEAYEEMMRKAELLQRQQGQAAGGRGPHSGPPQPTAPRAQGSFEYQDSPDRDYSGVAQPAAEGTPAGLGAAVYQEILQTSQSIARMHQASSRDLAFAEDKKKEKQFLDAESAYMDPMKQNGGPLTPGTSPTQLAAPVSFATSSTSDSSGGRVIPDVRVTQHFAKEPQDPVKLHSTPASPSSTSKEVGIGFAQGLGASASMAVTPGPAGLPRGYMAPTSPAASERSPSPSFTGHGYGQSPATANYGSQTEELPQAPRGPAVSGRATREKPLGMSEGESGPPQTSRGYPYFVSSSPPLSPSSPSESPTFSPGKLGPRATAEFSTQTPSPTPASDTPRSPGAPAPTPTVAQGTQTPHRPSTPRLVWQQPSQDAPFMVITLASDASSQTKMVHASASTSPVCSPVDTQPTTHSYSQTTPPSGSQPPEPPGPPGFPRAPSAGADGPLAVYGWGALPAENISLCRISSVPGTSRVEPGPRPPGSAVVDLRTAVKPTPIILTDQGMDLTSLAVEARKYGLALDPIPGRQSTAVQPLVINLNAQEQTHAFLSTATTVSITMASSVLMAQQKQPVVYGDPFQSRLDFGQGAGSPVCLAQVKQVEQAVQTAPYRGGPRGRPRETKFARYNLSNQVAPLARRDVLITQVGPAQSVGLKSGPVPEPGTEPHRAAPTELRSHALPGARKPHTVVVQVGEGAAGTVSTLLPEEPAGALDLTGMRPESQLACCDMVYKFPFGSSCTGSFRATPSAPERSVAEVAPPGQSSGPFYSPRDQEPPEPPTYRAQVIGGPGPHEEQRPYPQGLPGRLYSSMSDTNLAEAGLNYHAHRFGQLFQGPGRDSAMDLSSLKHSYSLGFADGRYLGQGLQYGSFTDLRHPTDLLTHPLPMRRYSSVSNIYSDHRYGPRGDAAGFQEASLAQYSATTAREISRMCAALNSMDQYGGRHGSGGGGPDLMQYQPQPGLSAPQGLAPLRPGLLGNPTFPEGQGSPGNLAQYRPTAGQAAAVRQLLPSTATVRAADGMIYSTINTPIAATLPITTQPASVLRPMVRGGMYRPYPPGGVAAVPLASLTRMPVIAPRIPLGPTGLYRYPVPSRFPTPASVPPTEGPVYLGKPAAAKAPGTGGPPRPELPAGAAREEPLSTAPPAAAKETGAAPALGAGQKPLGEATPGGGGGALGRPGLEKEDALPEERQRKQQEQLLQLERERVELEKLRQLRLQEELERERVELQRHREEEQLLVQRELQELQTLKHHVLQQQQEERQAQFALQREQLAQQRLQLEQIQQLQQQLQQQLEEQKQRQKPPFPMACEAPGRGLPPAVPELAQNGQYWPPLTHAAFIAVPEGSGQPREPMPHRGLPSSASDMSLQTEEPWEGGRSGGLKKRHSMPRLRDVCEPESAPEPCGVRRIADSSVQTDEEDGEGRYLLTRRRRARRSADCSVQTDDEDSAEWEQPVRRRRSRLSRHSDSGSDSKHDATASSSAAAPATRATSSVGIQTISDCSVQTEPDQLPRVSPAIHITAVTDPKVEIVRYISAPEKTGRGESLACQTEPEGQAQGVAGPQLMGPTAISPYLPGIQIVTPGPLGRFEKKKPDPLEIGYQAHLPPESLSQLVSRQPPKSPQVLYSPVSPLSPHRLLDTSFASSERLNKAHVSPQKHFTADSAFRQQTLPRPMKTLQRSLSDPKPLSPTAEESAKERFPLYQHQGGLGSQVSAPPPNGLVRKVKRTLPSPPPEEAHLPLAGQAAPPQLYAASLLQRGLVGPTAIPATKASLLRELDRDLRLVEHESTKLRKKQAELDEEEKEIDAKLKYLELGITQRKESLAKDRSGRDYPPLRGLSEHRDYLSDSELNQLRLQGYATPAGQYAEIPITAPAAAPTTPSGSAAFQPPRFPPPAPLYPAGSAGPTQNGFAAHQAPTYPGPSTYPAPAFPPGASYPAEPGLPSQQAFRPPGHYTAQTPLPTTQTTLFPAPADSRAPHQKPRQTSLADLEQKVSTNYEVIASPVVATSSAPSETSYSGPGPTASSSYEQGKAPELPRASDRGGVSLSPAPIYSSDSHYTSLEQTVPRNYVMIDDISELTKDSASAAPESQRLEPLGPSSSGRPAKEPGEPGLLEGSALPCCYTRGEEESEEDSYEPRGKSSHHRGVESNGRPASTHYYSDSDYRHGTRADKYSPGPVGPKHPSKSLAPAAVPSKRSKHRKQGMEQKISKFSPIEEAKDVESDLASYPSSAVSSSLASRGRKFQDEITYGLKKNVYEQQRYYGVSSRDPAEEDDRVYGGSSRSRGAPAYSGEKLSSHDFGGRAKGYEREREAVERLQKAGPKPSSLSMAHGRPRPPMRSQASEEESPVSPLGRPRPAGGPLPPGDACPPFCSSHSMPDVQEHVKEGPRSHSYKRDEGYILDDSHCVVSDSEAYHLGQEETDWFDKPRDARSDRFRHHGGHAVSSSSQKRGPARHSYHDYDEPPEEGLWPHDEGGPGRHASAKEHRHHGDHGRHSGRHAGEEPSRRAAKPHVRDVGRHEARPHPQPSPAPAVQKKGQPGYPSSTEYSQPSRAQSAYHHSSESKKGSRQAHPGPVALQPKLESQPQPQGRQAAPGPQPSQPPPSRQMPSATASRQPQTQPQPQQGLGLQPPQQAPSQARLQQQGQPAARGPASAASQPAGKPQAGPPTATGPQPSGPPRAEQANSSKGTAKAPQQGRPPQAQPPPGPGPAGVKAGAKPGGTPGAPAGQPGAEGESVLSKILPGGAAEQAGKLTEAVSAFGKKFSSFW